MRAISEIEQVPTGALDVLDGEISEWIDAERPRLGEVLVSRGVIDVAMLDAAVRSQAENGEELGASLIALGAIDEITLAEAVAVQFGIAFADLRREIPDQDAVDAVGEELCRRHQVVPMRIVGGRVFVATSRPVDAQMITELTAKCGRLGLLSAAPGEITRVLDGMFDALSSADVHIQAFELSGIAIDSEEPVDAVAVDENAPVVQVVNRIVTQGVRSRASDIHIEPHADGVRVRFRVDGALTDAIRLPPKMGTPIASRIKVLADLNIVERRRPQDGQFSTVVDGRPIDVRTSVVATVHGEKVVLRLLDKTRSLISLGELGMPVDLVRDYLSVVRAPLGMMLCTGPTGSGKTTTLYATLGEINDPTKNVITIEDPVEYQFDGINQMQVSEAAGITFADGLRGTLRQDPDTILVGEIRDVETARIATQAALTGHFVLSSLHAVDAVAAVHRFIDMGIESFLVASAISGVVGQRLLRRICSSCRSPFEPTGDQIRLLLDHINEIPEVWYRGQGCASCNGTGFRGRVGVYELLTMSDPLREMIVDRAQHFEMRERAIEDGMRPMQDEAFRQVVAGVTTVDEVLRAVYAPNVEQGSGSRPVLALGSGPRALPDAARAGAAGKDRGKMNHDGAAADASGDSESRPIALSSDSSEGEPVASEDEGVGVAL
ncbi:MAG TPA: GspE/PulE family protein [Microthrixaceae bacterium]|nr:GspE/PulE family protein [Microthrixaceae bacterium]HMT22945.1 GspE/PulE family protein [Microthrixaceae bacterium]HMT60133.1 GspE/PulE family protein [Microthrixaceae bacterium]